MSDCACLFGSDDGDNSDFSCCSWVTSRKPHKCVECRETIPRGAKYERYAGKWDGEMNTFRTCVACQDIRESLYCTGWTFGLLWEDVEDQVFAQGGLTIACVDKCATVEGKTKLQLAYMAWLES